MSEISRESLLEVSGQDIDEPSRIPLRPAVEYIFKCHGRDCEDNETLDTPVPVIVSFYQNPMRSVFSMEVDCKFVTGGHRQRCMASHQSCEDHDSHGHKVGCPYVTSIGFLRGEHKGQYPVRRNY